MWACPPIPLILIIMSNFLYPWSYFIFIYKTICKMNKLFFFSKNKPFMGNIITVLINIIKRTFFLHCSEIPGYRNPFCSQGSQTYYSGSMIVVFQDHDQYNGLNTKNNSGNQAAFGSS
jgi:hypothetical protein